MSGETVRKELQAAFVLHGRPYGDTSQLVEVFSREYGRLGLVAKGVRRPKSRLRGVLQPFNELWLSWHGRGELATLTGAEPSEPWTPPNGRWLMCGFYVNELILRLTHRHDPHPELYDHYRDAVRGLGERYPNEEVILRVFEKRLLDALGYGLLLDQDTDGQPVVPEGGYSYRLEDGPQALPDGTPAPLHGSTLLALHREELSDAGTLREAKRLLRGALTLYLGGRPLRSRELYRIYLEVPSSRRENEP